MIYLFYSNEYSPALNCGFITKIFLNKVIQIIRSQATA